MTFRRTLRAIDEPSPGPAWAGLFAGAWPSYRSWFLREGGSARPSYLETIRALDRYLPALRPTYDRLVELVGGGDLAARFLGLWRPPAPVVGCTQVVLPGPAPALVRTYDYSPRLWDAVVLRSAWGGRAVVAMTDCLWGVLDGVNEDGLCVSLAFGGRREVGAGFGITLVLRYLLETCAGVGDAVRVLERVPVHMTYHVALVDRAGLARTVLVGPGRPARILERAVTTNHEPGAIEWTRYVRATDSVGRLEAAEEAVAEEGGDPVGLVGRFVRPPIWSMAYSRGFGTLYSALYRSDRASVEFAWPDRALRQRVDDFQETELELAFPGSPTAPVT